LRWINIRGLLVQNGKMGMIALWGIAVFWNAISFPAVIAGIPEMLAKKEYIGFTVPCCWFRVNFLGRKAHISMEAVWSNLAYDGAISREPRWTSWWIRQN